MDSSTGKRATRKNPERRRTLAETLSGDPDQVSKERHTEQLSARKKKGVDGARLTMDAMPATAPASAPQKKKTKSFHGSLRLDFDVSKRGGRPEDEKGAPRSPHREGIETEDLPRTPTSSDRSHRTFRSPRRKKPERSEPNSPIPATKSELLQSIGNLTERLLALNARRKNLLQTGGSSVRLSKLFGEAEDARVDHEVAVNALYDQMGMAQAFNEHGIKHWLEWPLGGAGDQDEPAEVSAMAPQPLVSVELLNKLKDSNEQEIEAVKASAKDFIEQCDEKLNAIKQKGRSIDGQIRMLDEQRRGLLNEMKALTQDRNLQASFVALADDELMRRRSSPDSASGRPLISSVPVTPRRQQDSHQ